MISKELSPLRRKDIETGRMLERQNIIWIMRKTAEKLLIEAMNHNQYDIEAAEKIATVLEECALAIEKTDNPSDAYDLGNIGR